MLTRHLITRRADQDGVDAGVVERDYVLAHVVAQLHRARPADGGRLVFKGGTALRLVHIKGYRYSADLDFTLVGGGLDAAVAGLRAAIEAARELAAFPLLELSDEAKALDYVGPLESGKPRRVKVDIATDEVVESIESGLILAGVWPDLPEQAPFDVYPLEEIAAEKLRCVIQRVQCRDLYDIFRLTDDVGIRLGDVAGLFERKADAKSIDPATFARRFEDRVERYRRLWDSEMIRHLANPPRFDDVVRIVRRHLRQAGLASE